MKISSMKIGATVLVIAEAQEQKLRKALLDFIKDQTNVDLTSLVHERQSKPRRFLGVDMQYDSEEARPLKQLENRYKDFFKISPNGGFGIALVYGPKLLGK